MGEVLDVRYSMTGEVRKALMVFRAEIDQSFEFKTQENLSVN